MAGRPAMASDYCVRMASSVYAHRCAAAYNRISKAIMGTGKSIVIESVTSRFIFLFSLLIFPGDLGYLGQQRFLPLAA